MFAELFQMLMRPCHKYVSKTEGNNVYIDDLRLDFSEENICAVYKDGKVVEAFGKDELLKHDEIPFRVSRRILESRVTRRWVDMVMSKEYWAELLPEEKEEMIPHHLKRADLELESEHITEVDMIGIKAAIYMQEGSPFSKNSL